MNSEFQWRSELRKLGNTVEPQRDLWPQIAARIAVRPATQRWRMGLGLAAMFVLAFGVAMLAWRTQSASVTPALVATAPHHDSGSAAANAPPVWAVPADPKLAAAARDLHNASEQLQKALEQHPQAVFLVGLLNRTNARHMRLLRQAPSV